MSAAEGAGEPHTRPGLWKDRGPVLLSLRPWSRLTVLAAVVLGASPTVHAGPSWLELRWPEVAGCPSQVEVEAAVLRLTDGDALQAVVAEAVISTDARGYALQLMLRDAGGSQRRVLESPRCEALADATAVILAVAASPLVVAARVVAAPAPVDEIEVDFAPTARRSPPPAAAPERRPRPTFAVFFAAAAGIGPSRRFAPGLSGGLSLLWPRARLDLRGSGWLPSPLRFSGLADVGADLRLGAGAVRGCPRLARGSLSLSLCGGVELGALVVEGVGLQQNQASRRAWAAGLLAPGLQWRPLRWLSLGVEAEGVLAFTRWSYRAGDAPEILYTVPPVGVRLGGGIAVHFP